MFYDTPTTVNADFSTASIDSGLINLPFAPGDVFSLDLADNPDTTVSISCKRNGVEFYSVVDNVNQHLYGHDELAFAGLGNVTFGGLGYDIAPVGGPISPGQMIYVKENGIGFNTNPTDGWDGNLANTQLTWLDGGHVPIGSPVPLPGHYIQAFLDVLLPPPGAEFWEMTVTSTYSFSGAGNYMTDFAVTTTDWIEVGIGLFKVASSGTPFVQQYAEAIGAVTSTAIWGEPVPVADYTVESETSLRGAPAQSGGWYPFTGVLARASADANPFSDNGDGPQLVWGTGSCYELYVASATGSAVYQLWLDGFDSLGFLYNKLFNVTIPAFDNTATHTLRLDVARSGPVSLTAWLDGTPYGPGGWGDATPWTDSVLNLAGPGHMGIISSDMGGATGPFEI